MKKKRIIISVSVAIILVVGAIWLAWGNSALVVTDFTIRDGEIPQGFSGFRIAQISDLHDAEFGEDSERLVSLLATTDPDIIVITGDFIDGSRTDIDLSLSFAEECVSIAPTYYVTGNHEDKLSDDDYTRLIGGLTDIGVEVLADEVISLERNGEQICLMGVDDPNLSKDWDVLTEEEKNDPNIDKKIMDEKLDGLMPMSDGYPYTILLSHRPEVFEVYVEHEVDLVISGHLHGGQIRLPFIGGFYTPNQGIFPEFVDGLYSENDTNMIISRGLGNSSFPVRVNNRPEIVVIILDTDN